MKRWLAVIVLLAWLGCSVSLAQGGIIDCVGQSRVHIAHLRGWVFDPTGVVIPNVNLTLNRGDRVVAQTTSDENGRFDFKVSSGEYELRVQSQHFRAIPLKVHVGIDLHSLYHPGELRWILELAGMNCSWATTSVAEFEKEIRRFDERLKNDVENNARHK
jgi:hypothetical protein